MRRFESDGAIPLDNIAAEHAFTLLAIARKAAPHLSRVLERRHDDLSPWLEDEPAEPDLGVQACLQLAERTGPRPLGESPPPPSRPMCIEAFGMQLHAEVCIDGRDRRRLERMCRYFLRPPFAREAIDALPNGDVRIRFKQPTARGPTYVDVSRDVFLARLAALVPSPGFNMVRYYGALANGHHLNQSIRPRTETTQPKQLSLFELCRNEAVPLRPGRTALEQALLEPSPRRLSWGKLLGRVFQIATNCTLHRVWW